MAISHYLTHCLLLQPEAERDDEALKIWMSVSQAASGSDANDVEPIGIYGIRCSDRVNRLPSLAAYLPLPQRLRGISRILGPMETMSAMVCARWPFAAKERYMGDFRVAPRSPVLVVGNSFDAQTPLVSAHNVSAGIQGSTVLQVDGYGHTSLNLPSKCVVQRYAAYWVNGTMPEPGTICDVDYKPWSNITWDTVAAEIGWPMPAKKEH